VTGGGTWNQIPGVYFTQATQNETGDAWIAQNVSGGSTTVAVTWTAGNQEYDYVLELSPSVKDTAATGQRLASPTTTSITVPNSSTSALLLLFTIPDTAWTSFSATYTQGTGGPLNSTPFGYVNNPGDTAGRSATFTNSSAGENWGVSLKDSGVSNAIAWIRA
jgi:hypothetical protein